MAKLVANPHPGEILLEEFLEPMEITQYALAKAIHVPARRINEIVHGKRSVSAETDLLQCRYFGLTDGFFSRLQVLFDLREARRVSADRLAKVQPMKAA